MQIAADSVRYRQQLISVIGTADNCVRYLYRHQLMTVSCKECTADYIVTACVRYIQQLITVPGTDNN